MSDTVSVLAFAAALGTATVAGVFFAFSTFVMAALRRLPASQGIAAMQSINITAVRPAFMSLLFGSAAVCVALCVVALVNWGDRDAALFLTGGVLYLVGTIGVTIAGNVPLNDALAAADPADAVQARGWQDYVRRWTAWNHVRTAAAALSAAAFLLVLGW